MNSLRTVDHYFAIGSVHQAQGRPCEDYALSGTTELGLTFGVVSDGCSGVSANTDLGARSLGWAFARVCCGLSNFDAQPFDESFGSALLDAFKNNQFSPSTSDYLATMVGFVASNTHAAVLAHGDGAVALRYRDGRMALIEFNWANNMPLYLNYHTSVKALAEFMAPYQAPDSRPFLERKTIFEIRDGKVETLSVEESSYSVNELRAGRVLEFAPRDEGIACLLVMTDGYAQVGDRAPRAVAREFLAYKTTQGEFVKRRMLRALKEFNKAGAVPRDDVGVAAVWFDEPHAATVPATL